MTMRQGVVLDERDGVKFYRIPLFEQAGGVIAAFSTRIGGVSEGKLSSLNLGFSKPEPRENVQENYRRFFRALCLDSTKLVLTTQQHTDLILEDAHLRTGMGWNDFPDVVADAQMTNKTNVAMVKLTADCVPVLLYAPDVHAVAAVHDGWRSTAARLAQKTARRMCERYGADPKKMLAAIGPSIGPCCFEVDEPVMRIFSDAFDETIAQKTAPQKWHVDLWKCNVRQLLDAGLQEENIAAARICTRCHEEDLFFSYRRDGAGCGSLAAVIALTE